MSDDKYREFWLQNCAFNCDGVMYARGEPGRLNFDVHVIEHAAYQKAKDVAVNLIDWNQNLLGQLTQRDELIDELEICLRSCRPVWLPQVIRDKRRKALNKIGEFKK
jgi:hypothetical protein